MMILGSRRLLSFCALLSTALWLRGAAPEVSVTHPMPAPAWARLERRLLAEQVPACREFYQKYFDESGYLQCVVRWGANDGPDDAFENFNGWPELHALGADTSIQELYRRGHEGLLRQYTAARTVETPIAREGMYHREFIVQSDWMHHGEGLQLFNRMGLSLGGGDVRYAERARRFAGFYTGEDPAAPNYDPRLKLIRSMQNGSRGPMLRPATALDWVGDSFDVSRFVAQHGENTYAQFLAHYEEYTDVAGDHFLNLGATLLPTVAFLATQDPKYKQWLVEYMGACLERMRANGGILPSYVALDGTIGGLARRWWGNAYGWGFSPVNPVTGRRENRNRIPRAVVGFTNAVLLTGNLQYADAWRGMMDAVNANAREIDGRRQYPTMHGAQGWYGWQPSPWSVGALELWYLTQRPADRDRVTDNEWLEFLAGRKPGYPEAALNRDLETLTRRTARFRADTTPAERRLADNMLSFNPATIDALTRLMQGALVPGRDGGLLFARLRYFDPLQRRAGVPPDVAALVTTLSDRSTTVTLVNLSANEPRTVVMQAGAYAEHRIETVTGGDRAVVVDGPHVAVQLAPGSGAVLTVTHRRFALEPTQRFPWERPLR